MQSKHRYYSIQNSNMLLGALISKPSLLESKEAESLSSLDFADPLHKLTYGTIYNAYNIGHSTLSAPILESVIATDPAAHEFFEKSNGREYLNKLSEVGEPGAFIPAFNGVKKMTLFRELEKNGVDIKEFYDWDSEDPKTIKYQKSWVENTELVEIANTISDKIESVMSSSLSSHVHTRSGSQAGEGLMDLLESFKEAPDYGSPLSIDLSNTMVRGARLGKFYLRSAPTGGGKSRLSIADTVNFGVDKMYNRYTQEWEDNGVQEPSLFITTELEEDECKTMMLAYVTGINEDIILDGSFDAQEEKILKEGVRVLEESPIYIEFIPDFSIKEIENIIRTHYREKDVKYIAFDYIHSSMKFLAEITSVTGGVRLREDQILFMLSTKLKEIANELGVFIQSSTQLNGDWEEATDVNQNLLRGAKSIADRLDVGMIAMKVREIDRPAVEEFVAKGYEEPNYFISFYKVRRGKFAGTKLWCRADLGTCRVKGLFATDSQDVPISLDRKKITVKPAPNKKEAAKHSILGEQKSAF